ncbi:MAG TPA: VOC family protein [Acidimicrobiia bacterium]|nr:VOC family protein [Acidimicrobiia bacterium]
MPVVQVIGLDHLVLRCRDVEASLAFYCGELGLAPDRVDEWRRGEVPFPSARVDATTLIDLFPGPGGHADPTDVSDRNMDHVCLVIRSVDLDVLAARFAGSRRADGLYGAQGVASSVYVHDPDGNTVELRSYRS